MPRIVLYVLITVALLGGGYLALGPGPKSSDGVHYALIDHNRNPITETAFGDKLTLVSFGYTYCPDVCPTTLLDMDRVMELLGDKGRNLVPVFITIDPERDTPEVLNAYLSDHHPAMVGLTGSPDAITAAVRAFRAFAQKEPADKKDPDSYLMSHSALIYVVGANGRGPLRHFSFGDPPDKIAEALLPLL